MNKKSPYDHLSTFIVLKVYISKYKHPYAIAHLTVYDHISIHDENSRVTYKDILHGCAE